MTRARTVVAAAAGLVLLLPLSFIGCSERESNISAPGSGQVFGGSVKNVPQIAGEWLFTNSVIADSCISIDIPLAEMAVLQIVQNDTTILFELFDSCGNALGTGGGTVDTNDLVVITFAQTLEPTEDCAVVLEATFTGTIVSDKNGIDGGFTLSISPTGSPKDDCDDEFPCRIDGTFVGERCSQADCSFNMCDR